MLFIFEGKSVYKWHSALDKNGNKVAKLFYVGGGTEIVKGSRVLMLPILSDKFYHSLSGLYNSK